MNLKGKTQNAFLNMLRISSSLYGRGNFYNKCVKAHTVLTQFILKILAELLSMFICPYIGCTEQTLIISHLLQRILQMGKRRRKIKCCYLSRGLSNS